MQQGLSRSKCIIQALLVLMITEQSSKRDTYEGIYKNTKKAHELVRENLKEHSKKIRIETWLQNQ